jgi:hypothetical protein
VTFFKLKNITLKSNCLIFLRNQSAFTKQPDVAKVNQFLPAQKSSSLSLTHTHTLLHIKKFTDIHTHTQTGTDKHKHLNTNI